MTFTSKTVQKGTTAERRLVDGTARKSLSANRLLLLHSDLGPGGVGKNLALLANHRAERGDDVYLASVAGSRNEPYFTLSETVRFLSREARGPRPADLYACFSDLSRLLREVRPQLILSFQAKTSNLALLASLGTGIPVLISKRNTCSFRNSNALFGWLGGQLRARAYALVSPTENGREDLPLRLRRKSLVIANPCTPLPGFVPGYQGNWRFVSVGRLAEESGFDLLIRAFGMIARWEPRATLKIFGEGAERLRLEALVEELGLNDRVKLPGVTATPGSWMAEGDSFVSSSRRDGMCVALQEAIVTGMPAVSFEGDGCPSELILPEENGLLVPRGDIERLAASMMRVASDMDLRLRCVAAAPKAQARYAAAAILEKWDRLIGGAIAGKDVGALGF